jgi:hypothetical protein
MAIFPQALDTKHRCKRMAISCSFAAIVLEIPSSSKVVAHPPPMPNVLETKPESSKIIKNHQTQVVMKTSCFWQCLQPYACFIKNHQTENHQTSSKIIKRVLGGFVCWLRWWPTPSKKRRPAT